MSVYRTWIDVPERRPLASLVAVVLATEVVGASGSLLGSPGPWYESLARPPLAPPNWVFGPVWTVLFALLGGAAWLVWRAWARTEDPAVARRAQVALLLFGAQFLLNLAWSGVFFGLRAIGLALAVIGVLWLAILATAWGFARVDRRAGALLVPYLLWVGFAAYLNYGFWTLN